uniref:FK506-binding protein n=1 Tax=Phlebotomus papatasi TaxID=29031 RepID=A0A1B0D2F9_PHLPP
MVFGLVLTPNKKYSQTVEKDYQLSNAALDLRTCGQEGTQLTLTVDKNTVVLCTLSKDHPQHPLDLQFSEGTKIAFCTIGSGTIHLTGYMLPDSDFMGQDDEAEGEESEDVSDDEDLRAPPLVPIEMDKNTKLVIKQSKKKDEEDSDDDDDDDEDDDDDDDDDDEDMELEMDNEDDDDEESDDDEKEEEVVQPKKKQKVEPKQNGFENGGITKKELKQQKKKEQKENQQKSQEKQQNQQKNQEKQQKGGKKQTLQGGVMIEDLKVGDGPEAKTNKKVAVYYEGRLKSNNKVFDSCKSGNGFKFNLGRGEVIRGWDIGVAGMKVGSKRRITCPPQMAYGSKGSPPVIPPNSTLVFEVELRHVKN